MLELARTRVGIANVHGSAEAVDAAAGVAGAYPCRVAPDEVMLLGDVGATQEILRAATERASAIDPDAVVLDATDGWAAWNLAGEGAREAFAYLSALPIADVGFAQGEVAHVPAKVVATPDRVHVLVPSMWGAHLRERILADCSSFGVREAPDAVPWTPPTGGLR